MEPLQVHRELRRVHGWLEAAVLVPLEHVFDDGAGLVDVHVAVVEHGYAAERVAGAVFVRLQVLRMEGHLVDVVFEAQLL